uniref:Uncharacterized protein n=1 Tax=Oryza nivara TaxID=4536 RepID=A0A0E0GFT0_ORYNI
MYSKCLAVPTLASSTSRMGRWRCGRLSILVRLMSRNAKADSTLKSTDVPSLSCANTMLVLNGRSVRGMMGSRASITNRVTFPASSWMPSASTWSPYSSAAREDAMAAPRGGDVLGDVEAVAEEEVVVAVDAAAEGVLDGEDGAGVLDGEDGAVGDPELDGLEGHLELVAGDGVAGGVGLRRRRLAVCPRDTLVGDAQLAAVHGRGGEVGDGERAREVGDGEQIQVERRRGVVGEGGLDATVAVAVHPRDSADGGAGGVPVGAGERGGARRADGRGSGDVGGARRGRGFHPPAVSGGEAGAARGWWRERAASRGEARRGVV